MTPAVIFVLVASVLTALDAGPVAWVLFAVGVILELVVLGREDGP